jgi:hypothetical protein
MTTLPIWTIYDHPTDFPECFVARLFVLDRPTATVLTAATVDVLQRRFAQMGLVKIARSPGDDSKIVESWL